MSAARRWKRFQDEHARLRIDVGGFWVMAMTSARLATAVHCRSKQISYTGCPLIRIELAKGKLKELEKVTKENESGAWVGALD